MKNKAVFIDRDGTINVDGPYLADPDKFEMYPGVGKGVKNPTRSVSILVPTMNRSDFLIRLLNYYADTGFKHWILVGDSSDAPHVEKTKNAIGYLEGKLKIIYREYPGLTFAECMDQMQQLISTQYAVYVADDDFLVPDGLEQCMIFLENHQDYIAAHGVAIGFSLQSSGPYGQFTNIYNYRLPSIEAETASQRIVDLFDDYSSPLFSVHRTECWRAILKEVNSVTDRTFADELLPSALSVIQGKVKQLDCLYLVRHTHDRRYLLPNKYDWINSPNWEPSYKIFLTCLTEELARQDGLTLNEAKSIVEQAFRPYLNKIGVGRVHSLKGKGCYGRFILFVYACIRVAKKYIAGIMHVRRVAKYDELNRSDLLSALLSPSSPYYTDFMPIYYAVTKPTKSLEDEKKRK